MNEMFAASELSISQLSDHFSVHDQAEVMTSLQNAKFNLQMQVYELTEEVRRLQKVEPMLSEKTAELEGNKVLLVKARSVISKLQADQESATQAEAERALTAEARVAELTAQLEASRESLQKLQQQQASKDEELSKLQEAGHNMELSGTVRDMHVEALSKELEVRKRELDDTLGAQSELQAQLMLRHEEMKHTERELSQLREAKASQDQRWAEEQAELQGAVQEYERALSVAKNELSSNSARHNQEVSEFQGQMHEVRELNQQLEEQVEGLQAELEKTKVDLLGRVDFMEQALEEEEQMQKQLDQTEAKLQEELELKEGLLRQIADQNQRQQEAETSRQQQAEVLEERKLRGDRLEGELAELRHSMALKEQQMAHELAGLQDKCHGAEASESAAVSLHEQVSRRLHEESVELQQARTEIAALGAKLEAVQGDVARLGGELGQSKSEVERLKTELSSQLEAEMKAEKQHRKQLKATEEQHAQHVAEWAERVEAAGKREKELQESVVEMKTREGKVEAQVELMKQKVEECGGLMEQQALQLEQKGQASKLANEESKALEAERDAVQSKMNEASGVLRGWHLRKADGAVWDENKTLTQHLEGLLQHEAALCKKLAAMEQQELDAQNKIQGLLTELDNKRGEMERSSAQQRGELEELQELLRGQRAKVAEYDQWLKEITGSSADKERQSIQKRLLHHQELHIQVGEQLRSFLLSFPSVDKNAASMVHPFGASNRGGSCMWSDQDFQTLKEGLLVALQCVLGMFAAVETRWQKQYGMLTELVDSRTTDLHRLEEQVIALRRAPSQGASRGVPSPSPLSIQQPATPMTSRSPSVTQHVSEMLPPPPAAQAQPDSWRDRQPTPQPSAWATAPQPFHGGGLPTTTAHPQATSAAQHMSLPPAAVPTTPVSQRVAQQPVPNPMTPGTQRVVAVESSIQDLAHQIGSLKQAFEEKLHAVPPPQPAAQPTQNDEQAARLIEANQRLVEELERERHATLSVTHQISQANEQNQALARELQFLKTNPRQQHQTVSQAPERSTHQTIHHAHAAAQSSATTQADRAFDRIDLNKDGVVDREEFVSAFSKVLGFPLQPDLRGHAAIPGLSKPAAATVAQTHTTETFRTTGASLQRLRQECEDYRKELQQFDSAARVASAAVH